MTSVRVPAMARYAARLTTVVVLPTPPFWFVQAVTRTTCAPLRVQMGLRILPVFGLTGGLVAAYRKRSAAQELEGYPQFAVQCFTCDRVRSGHGSGRRAAYTGYGAQPIQRATGAEQSAT